MNKQLSELLKILRVKTIMYIGQTSIIRFGAFLRGYFFAIYQQENSFKMYECLGNFNDWLAQKYKIEDMLSWDNILLQVAGNDDAQGLELFWKEWDEFSNLEENQRNSL
jgi:hypothetical protein